MRISIQQLRRIIKEEVAKVAAADDRHFIQFTFIPYGTEDDLLAAFPDHEDNYLVLDCPDPRQCTREFQNRLAGLPVQLSSRADMKFLPSRKDQGFVVYGTPEDLMEVGRIFSDLSFDFGEYYTYEESDVDVSRMMHKG